MRLTKYLCIFVLFLNISCSNDKSNIVLLSKLNKTVSSVQSLRQGYKVIDLSTLTNFAWDKVYFFHGEENAKYISAVIGIKWNGPDVPNLHNRLLFVYKNNVVTYVDCSEEKQNYGEYSKFPALPIFIYSCRNTRERTFTKSEAKFALFRHCDKGHTHYAFIPLTRLNGFQNMLQQRCIEPVNILQ